MELVLKRTLVLVMFIAAFLVMGWLAASGAGSGPILGGGAAHAAVTQGDDDDGGDDDGDDDGGDDGRDDGQAPAGGVDTGGGGAAGGDDASSWPLVLGGLGALAGGSVLIRRFAIQGG